MRHSQLFGLLSDSAKKSHSRSNLHRIPGARKFLLSRHVTVPVHDFSFALKTTCRY